MSRTPSAAFFMVVALFVTPAVGKVQPCLTGTSAASDLSQITVVRAAIDTACPCANYDGSKGKTHAKYVTCASGVISAQVSAGNLRTQCKPTVKTYYSVSDCGVPASKGDVPCIATSAKGKVTCAIKAAAKCSGTACPGFATCIAAADTNGDGIIGIGDTGACAPTNTPTPASTPTPTLTPTPTATFTFPARFTPTPCTGRFCDNGDGTITDNQTGLMWEKKDAAGGIHDRNNLYTWSSGDFEGAPADGTAFTVFIAGLNAANFAGHADWRLPSEDGWNSPFTGPKEMESILAVPCTSSPCVSAVFNTNCNSGCTVEQCSCTIADDYMSETTYAPADLYARSVDFTDGSATDVRKGFGGARVRAVRP